MIPDQRARERKTDRRRHDGIVPVPVVLESNDRQTDPPTTEELERVEWSPWVGWKLNLLAFLRFDWVLGKKRKKDLAFNCLRVFLFVTFITRLVRPVCACMCVQKSMVLAF